MPTTKLWPDQHALFPTEWPDLVREWCAEVIVRVVPDGGHFVPLETTAAFCLEAACAVALGDGTDTDERVMRA